MRVGAFGAIVVLVACGGGVGSVPRRVVQTGAPQAGTEAGVERPPPRSVSFLAVPPHARAITELVVSDDGEHIAAIVNDGDRMRVLRDGVWIGEYDGATGLTLSPANGRVAAWVLPIRMSWPEPPRWTLMVDGRKLEPDDLGMPVWRDILPTTQTFQSTMIEFSRDGRQIIGGLAVHQLLGARARMVGERFAASAVETSEVLSAFNPRGELFILDRGLDGNELRVRGDPTGMAHVHAASIGFASNGTAHFAGQSTGGQPALYIDGTTTELAAEPTGLIARTARNRLAYVVRAGRQQQLVVDDRVRAAYRGIPFVKALDRTNSFVFVGADASQAEVQILGRPRGDVARAIVDSRVAVRADEACVAYTEVDEDGNYFVVTRPTDRESKRCEEKRRGPFNGAGLPAFAGDDVAFVTLDRTDGTEVEPTPKPILTLHLPGGATVPLGDAETSAGLRLPEGMSRRFPSPQGRIEINESHVNFTPGLFGVPGSHGSLEVRATSDGRLSHVAFSEEGALCFVIRRVDDARLMGPRCHLVRADTRPADDQGVAEPQSAADDQSAASEVAGRGFVVTTETLAKVSMATRVSVSPLDDRIAWSNGYATFLGRDKLRGEGSHCFRWERDGSLVSGTCNDVRGGGLYVNGEPAWLPDHAIRLKQIENGGGFVSIHGNNPSKLTVYLPANRRQVPIGVEGGVVTAHRMGSRDRTIVTTSDGLYDTTTLAAKGMALPEVRFSRDEAHYLGVVLDPDLSTSSAIVDGKVVATAARIFPVGFDAADRPVLVAEQGGQEHLIRGGRRGRPYRSIRAMAVQLDRTGQHVGYAACRADGSWVAVIDDREHAAVRGTPRVVLPSPDGKLVWTEQGANGDVVIIDGRVVATAQRVDDESLAFTPSGELRFRALETTDGRARWFLHVGGERVGPFDEIDEVVLAPEPGSSPMRPRGEARFAFLARTGTDWAFYVNGSRCAETGTPLSGARPRLVGDAATIVVRTSDEGDEVVRLRCALH